MTRENNPIKEHNKVDKKTIYKISKTFKICFICTMVFMLNCEIAPGYKAEAADSDHRSGVSKAKEEAMAQKRAEKINLYLEKARKSLDKSKFKSARYYVKKSMQISSDDTREAEALLEHIENEEKLYAEKKALPKKKKIRRKEEYRPLAEEKKAKEEKAAIETKDETDEARAKRIAEYFKKVGRKPKVEQDKTRDKETKKQMKMVESEIEIDDKIAGYLDKAEGYIEDNNFSKARYYAKKILKIDENSIEAKLIMRQVDEITSVVGEEKSETRKKPFKKKGKKVKRTRTRDVTAPSLGSGPSVNFGVVSKTKDQVKVKSQRSRIKKKTEIKKVKRKEIGPSKLSKYLSAAQKQLDKGVLWRARYYAKKALQIEETNREALTILRTVKNLETAEIANVQKSQKKRAEVQKTLNTKDEGKIQSYLARAREELDKNSFRRAKNFTNWVLEMDGNNKEALNLLEEIKREKESYKPSKIKKKETKSLRIVNPREKLARKPVKKAVKSYPKSKKTRTIVDENAKKQETITVYVSKAKEHLEADQFTKARNFAKKALKLDKNNESAKELIMEVSKAETVYRNELRKKRKEINLKQKAKKALKEKAKRDNVEKKIQAKAEKYIAKAKDALARGDYDTARKYAYLARDLWPENSDLALLVTELNKEEMFGAKKNKEDKIKQLIKKQGEEKREDFYNKHDEGKSWTEYVPGLGKKKTYELDFLEKGKIYTVDDCVRLAILRNQRMIVADKQVKLANMRVWENRRELFPHITGKIERGFGKIGTGEGPRHYQGEKYQVEVKHNVFDGMGNYFKVRQSQTNLDIVKLEKEKIKSEVIESTKTAYYNLDKAIKGLNVQKEYKDNVSKLHSNVDAAYKHEIVSREEYLKVKGQKIKADFQHTSSSEDVKLAKMILAQAMDISPDEKIEVRPVERPKEILSIGYDNCKQLAFANRPDFKIKERMIEYYNFERKIMKAKGWPKIEFQGSFGKSYEAYQPALHSNWEEEQKGLEPEWYAGVRTSVPLWGSTLEHNYVREFWASTVSSFKGSETATNYVSFKLLDDLAYFTNLQEARIGFESAKYELMKAKKDLSVEVKENYFRYKKSVLQLDVAEAQVEHQRLYVDVMEQRHRFAEMEASKVIDEYEKLAEHEYGMLQGVSDYYISLAKLNKTIGLSGYFKSKEENAGYEEWKEELLKREAIEAGIKKDRTWKKEQKKKLKQNEIIQSYIEKARIYLYENDFIKAKVFARKALEINSDDTKVKELIADIKSSENAHESKITQYIKEEEQAAIVFEKEKNEEKLKERAGKISDYMIKARFNLNNNDFSKAEAYAMRALSIEPGNKEINLLLENIKATEKAYKAEQKQMKEEKYRKRQAEREATLSEEHTDDILDYMDKAIDAFKNNNFKRARFYAKKAVSLRPENEDLKLLLEQIEKSEEGYKIEKAISSEKSYNKKPLVKSEAINIPKEYKSSQDKATLIAEYMEKSIDYIEAGNYQKARYYARKVVDITKGHPDAEILLKEIDKAERGY